MDALAALHASTDRLRRIVERLSDATLASPAYASEWTIAAELSHIGSGAVILRRRIDDALAGATTPDEFSQSVWDEWNAMTPRRQLERALAADADLPARLDAVTPDERRTFGVAMGPMTFDFDQYVGLRVNEHAFHTWDIEVALDPAATIPSDIAAVVVDNLGMIARFTGRPPADERTLTVDTTDPDRRFELALRPEGITLEPGSSTDDADPADLEIPAEAFARLVYGRLDPAHTPTIHGDETVLDALRLAFPGP